MNAYVIMSAKKKKRMALTVLSHTHPTWTFLQVDQIQFYFLTHSIVYFTI